MAVIVPGAEWRPDPVSSRPISLIWVILHTIVGTVAGSLSGRHYHIYVRANGTFVQIQDLLLRSAASVQANPYSIAIVAEDKGPAFPAWSGSNVPPYTSAQVDTIVRILVWICRRFGLPPEAVRNTCLGGAKGTCWHRLGIDGNWPRWPSIFRGRESSACLGTSLSTGKVCPGDERIKQINYVIIPRVIAILRGVPTPPPPTPSKEETVILHYKVEGGHPRTIIDGVLFGWPDGPDRDRIIADAEAKGAVVVRQTVSKATFDGLTASALSGQDADVTNLRLQAIHEIELREEQRDTAPPA